MPKISKLELKVRKQISQKENHLKALEFDLMTYTDRVVAVKAEIKTLNELLFDEDEEKKYPTKDE